MWFWFTRGTFSPNFLRSAVADRWTAHLEWLCEHAAVLRVFAPGKSYPADPYAFALTVRRDADRVAELKGLAVEGFVASTVPIGAWRAICRELARAGFRGLRYHRHSQDGQVSEIDYIFGAPHTKTDIVPPKRG